MKKIRNMVALSLALAMVLGNTAFASEATTEQGTKTLNITSEEATDGQVVTQEVMGALEDDVDVAEETTVSANDAAIAATAADVLTGGKFEYNMSSELSRFVQLGYAVNQDGGPFSITKGVLKTNGWWIFGSSKQVYVVALSGTDCETKNQTTGYFTDLLSGFDLDNKYAQNVKKTMLRNIPAGSNIILTGHSLGGMVAQQVAADSKIKSSYNVLNTVTFGSPLLSQLRREGTVKRLGDTNDIVPYLSVNTFTNVIWQVAGLNRENGGYGTNLLGAHCESYNRDDVWGAYDVTGSKNGNQSLVLDFSTTAFYHSPVTVTE